MLKRLRAPFSSDYLLGYAVVGGFLYVNRGEIKHLWRHYNDPSNNKSGFKGRNIRSEHSQHGRSATDSAYIEEGRMYCQSVNETLDSLRTGDLVFIRYNVERLKGVNRFKISAARSFSKGRLYDDVGLVYKYQGKTHVIMLPSFNLGVTNEDMRTMLIGGQKKRTRYVILEAQELVKHFVPDMITVKRLICDETKRKDLEEAVKRVCEVTHLPIRSTLIDIIKSWKRRSHNGNAFAEYRQCVQLIKGYEIMKQVEGNAVERDDVRQTMQAENSDHGEKETVSSFNQNVPQWDKTNRRFTGDGIEEVHKVCKGIMEEFERGKGKGFAPKRLCTATTFVTRVYSLSGFMPKTTEFDKLQIGELLELDFLPSHANQEVIRPRLSEPFNIFNGNHYRMMFRNLKELSNVKVLSNRL